MLNFIQKKLMYIVILLSLFACERKDVKKKSGIDYHRKLLSTKAIIEFEQKDQNFGNIKEGSQITLMYKFINKGETPLIIYNVFPGCGCTLVKWPRYPIKKMISDSIVVRFNSSNRIGIQHKVISILSNSIKSSETLSFHGIVK